MHTPKTIEPNKDNDLKSREGLFEEEETLNEKQEDQKEKLEYFTE